MAGRVDSPNRVGETEVSRTGSLTGMSLVDGLDDAQEGGLEALQARMRAGGGQGNQKQEQLRDPRRDQDHGGGGKCRNPVLRKDHMKKAQKA